MPGMPVVRPMWSLRDAWIGQPTGTVPAVVLVASVVCVASAMVVPRAMAAPMPGVRVASAGVAH